MIEWITEHMNDLLAIYGGFVVFATAVVKFTPTKKDDAILDKIVSFLDYFSVATRK